MVKIVIPVADGKADRFSEHFGRAPYFAVYDVLGDNIVEKGIFPNTSDHFGGSGHPPELILGLGAEVVISMGMGMRAISSFQEANVAVLRSDTPSAEEALQMYRIGELEELTEGCLHSHDQ
jgi:predicted Fe-Mo cluster-binding NifX family protein